MSFPKGISDGAPSAVSCTKTVHPKGTTDAMRMGECVSRLACAVRVHHSCNGLPIRLVHCDDGGNAANAAPIASHSIPQRIASVPIALTQLQKTYVRE